MDDCALKTILNLFPNIQRREEFYIDIVDRMSISPNDVVAYTQMSEKDIRTASGIICLSLNAKEGNSLKLELPSGTPFITLEDKIVINRDTCFLEKDLDNCTIRLSSDISSYPDDNIRRVSSNILGSLDSSVESLKKVVEEEDKADPNEVYAIVPHLNTPSGNNPFYSYHWTVPEEADHFLTEMPKGEDKQVKFAKHPRSMSVDSIANDEKRRRYSELTPDELEKHITRKGHNLVQSLPSPGESILGKAMRIYVPASSKNPSQGYIRFHKEHDPTTKHVWDTTSDVDTWLYLVALAEKIHNSDQQIQPSDIVEFVEGLSGRKRGLLAQYIGSEKGRAEIESKKKQLSRLYPDMDVLKEEEKSKSNDEKSRKVTYPSPIDILKKGKSKLIRYLTVRSANEKMPKKPFRKVELENQKRDNYYASIQAMSAQIDRNGIRKPAIDHLIDDATKLIFKYKPKLKNAISSEGPLTEQQEQQLSTDKVVHDNLIILYLGRKFGFRPQADDTGDIQGLTSLDKSNITFQGGQAKITFKGKGSKTVSKIVTDPFIVKLLEDQIHLTDKINEKLQLEDKNNPNARLFSGPGKNYLNVLRQTELGPSFTSLGLTQIIPYNLRHYAAVEHGIQRVREAAYAKLHQVISTAKEQKDKEKAKKILADHYKLIPDLTAEFDPFRTNIIGYINHYLDHKPGSTSWQKYVDFAYLTTAYKQALKAHLQDAYREIEKDVSSRR